MSIFRRCFGRDLQNDEEQSETMSMKKFTDECLNAHNTYRAKHGTPKLKNSKTLNAQAQKWADHLATTGQFQHSNADIKGDKLGENIAMKWSSSGDDYTGQQAADQWYSEISKHDFKSEPTSLGSGHFTQMIWRDSTKVGFGKAKSKDNKVIVVANYLPAGNFVGRFVENVPSPGSRPSKASVPDKKFKDKKDKGKDKKKGRRGSSSSSSSNSSPETFRKEFGNDFGGAAGGTKTSTETRTITTTDSSGKTVKKIITTETVISPTGQKQVSTTERTITEGTSGGNDDFEKRFKDMQMQSKGSPKAAGKVVKPQKMSAFIDDCVKAHNSARAKHGVPSVKHNKDLSEIAQKWAENLVKTGTFQHSQNTYKGDKLGENIASKWSSTGDDYTGQAVVDQWYSEISKHDFKKEPTSLGSGHFTQVIWKDSREVGFGKASTGDGRVIVVANYYPAGNWVGQFVVNVPPPRK